jgi:hypothetical protein
MTTKQLEVKRFLAHLAFGGALTVESAAQEMIDLDHTTCRQFLEMKPDQILIVMGWLKATTSTIMLRLSSTSKRRPPIAEG